MSCIIVSNGFANTGNSARSKLKFANSPSNSEITSDDVEDNSPPSVKIHQALPAS